MASLHEATGARKASRGSASCRSTGVGEPCISRIGTDLMDVTPPTTSNSWICSKHTHSGDALVQTLCHARHRPVIQKQHAEGSATCCKRSVGKSKTMFMHAARGAPDCCKWLGQRERMPAGLQGQQAVHSSPAPDTLRRLWCPQGPRTQV